MGKFLTKLVNPILDIWNIANWYFKANCYLKSYYLWNTSMYFLNKPIFFLSIWIFKDSFNNKNNKWLYFSSEMFKWLGWNKLSKPKNRFLWLCNTLKRDKTGRFAFASLRHGGSARFASEKGDYTSRYIIRLLGTLTAHFLWCPPFQKGQNRLKRPKNL